MTKIPHVSSRLVARHEAAEPPEFSVGFQRSMGPLIADRMIAWWQDWPFTHTVIFLRIDGAPVVFQSFPNLGRPFRRSGPQLHSLDEFENVVIPFWEKLPWARRTGGIFHWWMSPPWPPTAEAADKARRLVVELASDESIKYGLFLNYFFGRKNQMHCSQTVGLIQRELGYVPVERYTGHRFTPADCYKAYLP